MPQWELKNCRAMDTNTVSDLLHQGYEPFAVCNCYDNELPKDYDEGYYYEQPFRLVYFRRVVGP